MNPEQQPIHNFIYWLPSARLGDNGERVYSEPVKSSRGRFLAALREAQDGASRTVAHDSRLTDHDFELPIGSIVFQGTENDLTDPPTNLFEVVDSNTSSDIKGRNTRYSVFLARFKDQLPGS